MVVSDDCDGVVCNSISEETLVSDAERVVGSHDVDGDVCNSVDPGVLISDINWIVGLSVFD